MYQLNEMREYTSQLGTVCAASIESIKRSYTCTVMLSYSVMCLHSLCKFNKK